MSTPIGKNLLQMTAKELAAFVVARRNARQKQPHRIAKLAPQKRTVSKLAQALNVLESEILHEIDATKN